MTDQSQTTIYCAACNDVGWVPFGDGHAPCEACQERRQAETMRILNAGGSVRISIGMDGSITRHVKDQTS